MGGKKKGGGGNKKAKRGNKQPHNSKPSKGGREESKAMSVSRNLVTPSVPVSTTFVLLAPSEIEYRHYESSVGSVWFTRQVVFSEMLSKFLNNNNKK